MSEWEKNLCASRGLSAAVLLKVPHQAEWTVNWIDTARATKRPRGPGLVGSRDETRASLEPKNNMAALCVCPASAHVLSGPAWAIMSINSPVIVVAMVTPYL